MFFDDFFEFLVLTGKFSHGLIDFCDLESIETCESLEFCGGGILAVV